MCRSDRAPASDSSRTPRLRQGAGAAHRSDGASCNSSIRPAPAWARRRPFSVYSWRRQESIARPGASSVTLTAPLAGRCTMGNAWAFHSRDRGGFPWQNPKALVALHQGLCDSTLFDAFQRPGARMERVEVNASIPPENQLVPRVPLVVRGLERVAQSRRRYPPRVHAFHCSRGNEWGGTRRRIGLRYLRVQTW